LVKEAIDKIKSLKDKEGLSGVPSGFRDVDKETGGWQNSDLIIIAARPAMGKTAFILSMARNICVDHHIPMAFFSGNGIGSVNYQNDCFRNRYFIRKIKKRTNV
jgi:replicative DNA helicase